jgi:hypothetical protein
MYPAGIVFIFALAASSYVLLTQWRHYKKKTFKILAAVLVFVQVVIVGVSSVRGTLSAPDLSALLAVLVFGLLGMGIGICVAALLIRAWAYAESAILGLFAIMVTILRVIQAIL